MLGLFMDVSSLGDSPNSPGLCVVGGKTNKHDERKGANWTRKTPDFLPPRSAPLEFRKAHAVAGVARRLDEIRTRYSFPVSMAGELFPGTRGAGKKGGMRFISLIIR